MIDRLVPSPGRDLQRPELERLVEQIGARPDLWMSELDLEATVRTYASLHRGADVDVWALCWRPDTDTGWHDHDTSSGAVHVVDGALEEHALRLAAPERRRRYTAGATFSFDGSHIHRVTCAESHAVSIHAYSPPLWRLGQYTVDGEGALHRLSVSYADELRPLELA
jgi:predicted metal-dependent enzyme (double-stranded beta helix superfamily)